MVTLNIKLVLHFNKQTSTWKLFHVEQFRKEVKIMSKVFTCIGYNFAQNNRHLIRVVGETHTLEKWLTIIYPDKDINFMLSYFEGYNTSEIIDYIFKNMQIRLTLRK